MTVRSVLFLLFLLSVMAFGAEMKVETKRRGPMNPYSWMSASRGRRSLLDSDLETEEEKRAQRNPYSWMLSADKRARNPYSWMAERSADTDGDSLFGSIFSPKDKKFGGFYGAGAKRTRNPYSWMNFV